MSYLPLMLEANAFDNICHEHLEYYSLTSLRQLLARHDLQIVDAELNDVNGGSFRVYACHVSRTRPDSAFETARVNALDALEQTIGLASPTVYEQFAARVGRIRSTLHDFVRREVGLGKTIYVYGASTKGNTLLQYCGLDATLIKAAAERNPDKWGRRTVGTAIPIVSEDDARRARPDYFLVLPWHFLKEFMERERAYLAAGGRFLVPLPYPEVVTATGRQRL
jgi:NDP-4-keto-2,6-dideoxyhexose 3-C-methyltransferase